MLVESMAENIPRALATGDPGLRFSDLHGMVELLSKTLAMEGAALFLASVIVALGLLLIAISVLWLLAKKGGAATTRIFF